MPAHKGDETAWAAEEGNGQILDHRKMAIITAILLAAVIVLGVWVVTLVNREEPVQTVLYGRSGHYSWVPLKQDVEKNGYDFDGFSTTGDGFVMYEDGGRTTTMQGIDVSYYQGDIDWNKVVASE